MSSADDFEISASFYEALDVDSTMRVKSSAPYFMTVTDSEVLPILTAGEVGPAVW